MREIKFRAWDKDKKEMIDNEYWLLLGGDGSIYEYSLGKLYTASHYIIMQYTGLLDKNGKEIYEGDIVNYGKYTDNKKDCNEEIIFENGSFVGKEIRKFGDVNKTRMIGKDCEIIGNIYEHGHLLDNK